MYLIRIKIDNVSLRAFLFLQDMRNKGKEVSNTTICDYILDNYKDYFLPNYKNEQSFRSGYAGNLSLIFDADESQEGKINKKTKLIPKKLQNILSSLKSISINFDGDECVIKNIPTEEAYQLLCIFFCLKPTNARINKIVSLDDPYKLWVPLLARKVNRPSEDFKLNKNQITGRGDAGRASTLNRYTIYSINNNWFDLLKPNYFNFTNLRYKLFLHNLMIEQDNMYICILKTTRLNFEYQDIFDSLIKVEDDTPSINGEWIDKQINFNDILLVSKNDLRDLIVKNIPIPPSFEFTFTVIGNILYFEDGNTLDLSPILITDYSVLENSANLNPNLSVNLEDEERLMNSANSKTKAKSDPLTQIRKRGINGEESHTIMKFIDLSRIGNFKIKDYTRNNKDEIIWGEEKTCLIIYNGTRYPDLMCIFLEDAEKIEKCGDRPLYDYCYYIYNNLRRFEHLIFEVEAEYNVTSFKDHDESKQKVLMSKYVFCENKSGDYYQSKFDVQIPVYSIKDFQ